MMVGIGAQAVGFVILARALGNVQFGQLTTISAAASLGAAWVQLGSAEAMRRRVGRDRSLYPAVLGHAVTLIFGWGAIVSVLFSAVMSQVVHVVPDKVDNFAILLAFVICNIVLYPWIVVAEQIFLAHGKFTQANIVNGGFGVARALTAISACLAFGVHSLPDWAIWNGGVYLGGALACGFALRSYGAPRLGLLVEELPIGATFGISGFLTALRQNVDLLALSVAAPSAVVGTYGLARRIIAIAVVTGASLDRMVYAKLAIAGQRGPSETLKLARRYVVLAVALTGATSLALYFIFSPMVPWIFGSHFEEATTMLNILCWTLILTGVQNIAFDALNAADLHRLQIVISAGAVLTGSAAIVALTLIYGINGVFVAVYLSEFILALALWRGLLIVSNRPRETPAAEIP
jgi:O-antigen/teichoic acid export membrane protein